MASKPTATLEVDGAVAVITLCNPPVNALHPDGERERGRVVSHHHRRRVDAAMMKKKKTVWRLCKKKSNALFPLSVVDSSSFSSLYYS